jgi:hypothetical protein
MAAVLLLAAFSFQTRLLVPVVGLVLIADALAGARCTVPCGDGSSPPLAPPVATRRPERARLIACDGRSSDPPTSPLEPDRHLPIRRRPVYLRLQQSQGPSACAG